MAFTDPLLPRTEFVSLVLDRLSAGTGSSFSILRDDSGVRVLALAPAVPWATNTSLR